MEAAFFDLDKTVIARASMVAFGKPLYRAGLLSRWLLLRALYGQLVYLYMGANEERMARMRESALRVTVGWERDRILRLVRETMDEVIDPIVYDEALDLIREHQAKGRRVFIISASPEEVVAPLAEYLGADEAIATRPRTDEDGRYTGEIEFYAYGPFKAEAMQQVAERDGLDLERLLGLLGLGHRHPHAGGRGAPGRRQSRPRPGRLRGRTGVGGPRVRRAGAVAQPGVHAETGRNGGGQRRAGHDHRWARWRGGGSGGNRRPAGGCGPGAWPVAPWPTASAAGRAGAQTSLSFLAATATRATSTIRTMIFFMARS